MKAGARSRGFAITDMKGCTSGSVMMPTLIPAVVQPCRCSRTLSFIVGKLHIELPADDAAIFRGPLPRCSAHVARQITIYALESREISEGRRTIYSPPGGEAECPELEPPDPPPEDNRHLLTFCLVFGAPPGRHHASPGRRAVFRTEYL